MGERLIVTNGDEAVARMREAELDAEFLPWRDVLHDGPVPSGVSWEALSDTRARHLAEVTGLGFDRISRGFADRDALMHDQDRFSRIELWFEHDLFDQLQIVRTLSRLGRSRATAGRTSLICIDRFPGVDPFFGLGQLDARQLSSLSEQSRPVTPGQFEIASRTWAAFRAADPSDLNDLWAGASESSAIIDALPFLRRAIGRFLAEYPSATNGLSTTLNFALQVLDASPLDGGELFRRTQSRETAPFMGDSPFFHAIGRLATARVPLVDISTGHRPDLRDRRIALTADGREVLAGRLDAVAQNGIDEWRGGVHLQGTGRSPWRWDSTRETLISWSQ